MIEQSQISIEEYKTQCPKKLSHVEKTAPEISAEVECIRYFWKSETRTNFFDPLRVK